MKINISYFVEEPEIFKPVTFPRVKKDLYAISNYGTIKNIKRNKIKKQHYDDKGYKMAMMMLEDNNKRPIGIHQLVAWEFCEGYDESKKIIIAHHDDNDIKNNYYQNIKWVTIKYNSIHSYMFGNGKKGIDHYRNKYSEELVHYICEQIEGGNMNMDIETNIKINFSDQYCHGIHDLIKDIRRKRVWKHISQQYKF